MEYPANNGGSNLDDVAYNRKRKLIVIGVVAVFLIIFGLIVVLSNKTQKEKPIPDISNSGRYKDPYSGQTVSDPPDKAPELYGRNPDAPIFLGTTKLLNYGITSHQVKDFQFGIFQYFQSKKQKIKEVSVDVSTITLKPHDRYSSSTVDTVNFDVVIDRTDRFKVQMDYYKLTAIHMYMNDSSGQRVYDSGELDNKEIIPVEQEQYPAPD